MNSRDDGFKTVDELAISVSIVLELLRVVFEQLKDVIGRMTGLKATSQRMTGWINSNLVGIFGKSGIEDVLKRRRRHFGTVC